MSNFCCCTEVVRIWFSSPLPRRGVAIHFLQSRLRRPVADKCNLVRQQAFLENLHPFTKESGLNSKRAGRRVYLQVRLFSSRVLRRPGDPDWIGQESADWESLLLL